MDAHWWLCESGGEMNIVLLISVQPKTKDLTVEKWELIQAPRPITRATSNLAQNFATIPACVSSLKVGLTTITRAPLVLEFDKVFARPPVNMEEDIVYSEQDLRKRADAFWDYI